MRRRLRSFWETRIPPPPLPSPPLSPSFPSLLSSSAVRERRGQLFLRHAPPPPRRPRRAPSQNARYVLARSRQHQTHLDRSRRARALRVGAAPARPQLAARRFSHFGHPSPVSFPSPPRPPPRAPLCRGSPPFSPTRSSVWQSIGAMSSSNVPQRVECDVPGKARYQIWRTTFEIDDCYQPIKAIGKGAYGVVCSARDTRTGDKVAIKKITNAFENLVDARRTLREMRLLRYLRCVLLDGRPPSALRRCAQSDRCPADGTRARPFRGGSRAFGGRSGSAVGSDAGRSEAAARRDDLGIGNGVGSDTRVGKRQGGALRGAAWRAEAKEGASGQQSDGEEAGGKGRGGRQAGKEVSERLCYSCARARYPLFSACAC